MFSIPSSITFNTYEHTASVRKHPLTTVREESSPVCVMYKDRNRVVDTFEYDNIPRVGWKVKGLIYSDNWLLEAPAGLTMNGHPLGYRVDMSELTLLLKDGSLDNEPLLFIENESKILLIRERDLQLPEMQALRMTEAALKVNDLTSLDIGAAVQFKTKKAVDFGFVLSLRNAPLHPDIPVDAIVGDDAERKSVQSYSLVEILQETPKLTAFECLGHYIRTLPYYDVNHRSSLGVRDFAASVENLDNSMVSEEHLSKFLETLKSFTMVVEPWSSITLTNKVIVLPNTVSAKIRVGSKFTELKPSPDTGSVSFNYPIVGGVELCRVVPLITIKKVRNSFKLEFERRIEDRYPHVVGPMDYIHMSFNSLEELLISLKEILNLNGLKLRGMLTNENYFIPASRLTFKNIATGLAPLEE